MPSNWLTCIIAVLMLGACATPTQVANQVVKSNLAQETAHKQGVDTSVLNSQEFIRGITTPMPPSLMLYYLDQGWPQQMVFHLFVREIELYNGKSL